MKNFTEIKRTFIVKDKNGLCELFEGLDGKYFIRQFDVVMDSYSNTLVEITEDELRELEQYNKPKEERVNILNTRKYG